mgnify:CR=1 FL=1
MTIISTTRADVPVIIIDQGRLADDLALQELYEEIVAEVEHRQKRHVVLDFELVETIGSPSGRPTGVPPASSKEATRRACTSGRARGNPGV